MFIKNLVLQNCYICKKITQIMNSIIKYSGILLLAILSLNPRFSNAQNYEALKADANYYFFDSINMDIIVERIDSVALIGNETRYYGMKQIRQTDFGCFTPYGDSWMGEFVTKDVNGIFQFTLNPFSPAESSDIYMIRSKAIPGESWHFYNYHSNNHYLEAKVTEISVMNFIGITDSVKTITLQHKDASGQTVNDLVNGQKILLSKNFGLIRTPKFDDFNNHLTFLDICGKTNPNTGRTNLTFEEIFDFQPGDEFHSQYLYTPYVYYYPTEEGSVIQTILEKITENSPDTVMYRIAECKTNIHKSGMSAPVYSHTFDTIIKQFSLTDYKELVNEPKEPYILNEGMEYLSDNNMGISANSFMNLQGIPWKFTNASGILWTWNSPDCWNYATIDEYTPACFFYKGLGGPYYSWMGFNITFNYNKLVYYKKSSETWGTPLNCDSLMQVGIIEYPQNHRIKIYPNPTSGLLTVSMPVNVLVPCKLEIVDLSGRIVLGFTMTQQTQSFDISELPSGLYSYKLSSTNGDVFRGKIIRQ